MINISFTVLKFRQTKNGGVLVNYKISSGKGPFILKNLFFSCMLAVSLVLCRQADAQQPKRIYIANDDHTDYFWTADEETYKNAFLNMLDYYLDMADSTSGERYEHQSRWNCDGSFWLWTYEQNRSAAQFNRLINRIKDGHISVPLNALVVCLGGAPAEAVIRGMYYPGEIERKYGVKFNLAIAMENQTLPYGLPGLWSGAGAKYSWKGVCGCDTRVQNFKNRDNEIYWAEGPAAGRILMKWNSLYRQNTGMGGYAEARFPGETVEFVSSDAVFIRNYPYKIIGAFGKGWDDLQTLTDEFVMVAREKTDTNRTVIVSNEEDFFADFDSTYGGEIPTVSSSFGNEWDLYCASLAEVSARVKRAVEKLRGAEAMSLIVNRKNKGFYKSFNNDRKKAWMDMGLFWEHNFGMVSRSGQIVNERIDWQNKLATEIEDYVETLFADAASELGGMIKMSGGNKRFYVFNQLNWERTDVADIEYNGSDQVHVLDLTTGEVVPSQLLVENNQKFLRILAPQIPSLGYKVFEIRGGTGVSYPDAGTTDGNKIENDYYSIVFEGNGALKSLIDKSKNKEFVQEVSGKFLNDLGGGTGTLELESVGPVSITLKASSEQPLMHTTRLTLYKNIRRIDIKNEITQNFSDTYMWNFGFNLINPEIWHEEVGAVIKAKLKSHGGRYSDSNARYDWLTMNHFADISDADNGVTISNPDCYFMKIGKSTADFLDENSSLISVLAGGKVGGYGGLPDQGGDSYFMQRFALQTHSGYHAAVAMRFALEHQNPLVTSYITGGNFLPETSYSFMIVDNPNVIVWALKPAEDELSDDMIVRVWNMSDKDSVFSLDLENTGAAVVKKTSLIETPAADNSEIGSGFNMQIMGNQMQTYAVNYAVTSVPFIHTDFKAVVEENNVTLNWSMLIRTDIKGFEIYRNNRFLDFISAREVVDDRSLYTYRDTDLTGGTYEYKLVTVNLTGKKRNIDQIEIVIPSISGGFLLQQNYPNPFNPVTVIKFSLANDVPVSIIVYNALGEMIREILNKNMGKGSHQIIFDAKGLSSGVYFYTMKAGDFTASKKLVIIN